MRDDIAVQLVLEKCEVLKRSSIWPSPPRMRPSAWISNFEEADRKTAASLLDRFTFCNSGTVNAMLKASWSSMADGYKKGPEAPGPLDLLSEIGNACFTPVAGETPNPSDSGYLFCRKARQELRFHENLLVDFTNALDHAKKGLPVVFLDDFVGSGDQFLSTWKRVDRNGDSFECLQSVTNFVAVYITLVTTDYGLARIHAEAPKVAVCHSHVVSKKSTVFGLMESNLLNEIATRRLIQKYSKKLRPKEEYIANNLRFLEWGYAERGLLLGFEHSIPDATLPIFWSPGIDGWEPLIERL